MTSVEPSYARLLPRLLLLAASVFVVSTNGLLVAGILTPLGRAFDVGTTEVGYTITWYSASVAVLSPVVGIALARVPRGLVLGGALLVFAGGAAVAASAPDLGTFIGGRVIAAVGAAAIMPTALSVAATIAPPHRRGTALAITSGGFTLAAGLGAPAATALASLGGWRTPVWAIAGLAVVLAVVVAVAVRGVPVPPPLTLAQRFSPLRDPRLLLAAVATLFAVASFNIVYIFLAEEARPSIGASLAGLAGLQLVIGIAGVVGNVGIGPIVDRVGALRSGIIAMVVLVAGAALLSAAEPALVLTVVVLAVWGLAGGAVNTPIQHRIVTAMPDRSAIALSWNSTAMYLGIAAAPLLGGAGLSAGGGSAVPAVAAISAALALVAFLGGWAGSARDGIRSRRSPDRAARPAQG